jgi:hypothetical protein
MYIDLHSRLLCGNLSAVVRSHGVRDKLADRTRNSRQSYSLDYSCKQKGLSKEIWLDIEQSLRRLLKFCFRLAVDRKFYMRFDVLTAVSVKTTVLWDVTPCGLTDISVSEELSLHLQRRSRLRQQALRNVDSHETIRRHVQDRNRKMLVFCF